MQSDPFEAVSHRFVGGFGRISLSPFVRADAPGHFNTGAERQRIGWNVNAHEPDEFLRVSNFHRPASESVGIEVFLDVFNALARLRFRHGP